jgi:hypothetical protein
MNINVTVSFDTDFTQFIKQQFGNIQSKLQDLKTQGAQTMAQIDDLNTAIQAEDVELTTVQASIVTIAADVTRLIAAVKAGGTPTDLTNQLTAVQAHLAALTTANQQLVDADTASKA